MQIVGPALRDSNVCRYGADQSYTNRQADPELSEMGRLQAQILREFFSQRVALQSSGESGINSAHDPLDFTHVYASWMVRTIETARAVGDAVGLTPAIWGDLHEMGGFWVGDPETGRPVGSAGRNRAYYQNRSDHLPPHLIT